MEVSILILLIVMSLMLIIRIFGLLYLVLFYQNSLEEKIDILKGEKYQFDSVNFTINFLVWISSLALYLELVK